VDIIQQVVLQLKQYVLLDISAQIQQVYLRYALPAHLPLQDKQPAQLASLEHTPPRGPLHAPRAPLDNSQPREQAHVAPALLGQFAEMLQASR
jgi:hypothetical protein